MSGWTHRLVHRRRAAGAALAGVPLPSALDGCPACAREFAATRSLLDAARARAARIRTAPGPDEDRFLAAVRARLDTTAHVTPPARPWGRALVPALALATVLLVAAGLRLALRAAPPPVPAATAGPHAILDAMADESAVDDAYPDADLEAIIGDPELAGDLDAG